MARSSYTTDRRFDALVLGVLVLVSVLLLLLSHDHKVTVAREVSNALLSPLWRASHVLSSVTTLREENRELRKLSAGLLLERDRLVRYRVENERLRALIGFVEESRLTLLPAEVVGRETREPAFTLLVAKGTEDGVRLGQAAITHQGLAGKVVLVGPSHAYVQPLLDPECRVSVLVERSRVTGIVGREYGGGLQMFLVPLGADIVEGDRLVTSGLGGVYPRGISVGTVTSVTPARAGLFEVVDLAPAADFQRLEELFLVTGRQEEGEEMEGAAAGAGPARREGAGGRQG